MSPATETGFEDAETEVLRNMWLARWGSEPVTIERVYEDLALVNEALVRDVAEYNPHNDTWTLKPNANN